MIIRARKGHNAQRIGGRQRAVAALLTAVLVGILPVAALAKPGDPDITFSGDGIAITDVRLNDGGVDSALDSANRPITVGYTAAASSPASPLVARHLPSGSLDTGFSGDGLAVLNLGAPAYATSVAIDSKGRIVVGGVRGAAGTDAVIIRLTSNGALDPSFSGDGIATMDLGTADIVVDIAVDAQDRPIVAGTSDGKAFVSRFTSSGSLDPAFSGDGTAIVGPGGVDRATGVIVDGNRIVVAGSSDGNMFLTRLVQDGSADPTFSGDGIMTVAATAIGAALVRDAAGSLTIAGTNGDDILVARVTTSGALDSTFSGDGKATVNFGAAEAVGGLALDVAKRVIITGSSTAGTDTNGLIAVLTPSGAIDTTYAAGGSLKIDLGGDELLAGTSAGADGAITIAGQRFDDSGSSMLTIRLEAGRATLGPTPDNPFIDDDDSIFEDNIEALARAGITKGCNPPTNDRFCPDDVVTRGQMAAFLVRALNYTDRATNAFTDDDDSIFQADIERLAAAGVTKGCNPPTNDRYCPDQRVTRGQMAAFLVRALGYTDSGPGDLFVDDDDSVFSSDIDKLGTAGVTRGCNPPTNDRFCPNDPVTRGQMAAFLVRALNLS